MLFRSSECDLDYEKSIMEIKNLLDTPHDMDLEVWKANSESCSPTSTSEPLLIEPPPHVDHFVDVKDMLGIEGLASYDFLGVDLLLSHHRIWIGPFLFKHLCPYYVTSLLVGVVIVRNYFENIYRLMVGAKQSRWKDLLLINYKKRKKDEIY